MSSDGTIVLPKVNPVNVDNAPTGDERLFVGLDGVLRSVDDAGTIHVYNPGSVSSVNGQVGFVTLTQTDIGLSNVNNTSDVNKPVSTAQQTALNLKVDQTTTVNGHALSSNVTVTQTDVGLSNVDNTSDATKNAATATLTNKTLTSPIINSPTGIVKVDVGLGNVDNTSDVNKPVSTAQQTALNLKINLTEKGAALGVATLDINSLIPITQIPPTALERLIVVADQTARFALTTATTQNGDTVKQNDTGLMYFVIDDTNLGNSTGYSVYVAGTAAAVPWGGITGIPAPVTALTGTNTGDQTITLTGGVTGSGTGSFAATVVTNANLTGGVTSVGNDTTVVTNANLTGGVTSVGNATTVITNANLTGPITSVGNATAIADGAIAITKLAVPNTQVVYGDSTGFAGSDSAFTFNDTTKALTATTFIGALTGLASSATTAANTTATTNSTITTLSALSLPTTQLSGTIPIANGGTGTATTFTQGSVIFAGASGVYSQDNANFFYDATNHRLGLGIAVPTSRLHVVDAIATAGYYTIATIAANSTGSTVNTTKTALSVSNSGTWVGTGTKTVGIDINSAGGGSVTNTGLSVTVSGSTNNIAATFMGGNVGIGVTAPYSISSFGRYLTVGGSTSSLLELAGNTNSANTPVGGIDFINTISGNVVVSSIRGEITSSAVGGILRFLTNAGGSLTEKMRINMSGNVGINTTADTYKLDVNGTFNVSGATTLSGVVSAAGGVSIAVAAKTTTYTLTATDSMIIADTTGGVFTITLPTAVGISGRIYRIKNKATNANLLTVNTTSSQTIDLQLTQTIQSPNSMTVISDGANWWIV